MDKFEQFFKENRLRLDTEDLDSTSWKNIEEYYKHYTGKRIFRQIYVAASIAIIIGLGSLLLYTHLKQKNSVKQTSIFYKISANLIEQETSYIQSIDKQLDKIKKQKIPKENAPMFDDFIKQLQLIDKQYDLFKAKVEKHGYNDELIQQIIYNYQLKLSLLQMLQSEIDKINNLTKQRKNEKEKIQLDI